MTSGITGLVTWKVSQKSASVELAKVAAENERLQYGSREEERRNRQSTYHQFLDAATTVYQFLGFPVASERRSEACKTYAHLLSGVVLFGPQSVRTGAYAINHVYQKIWPALAHEEKENPGKPASDCWGDATAEFKDDFGEAISAVVHLMHADVTSGIARDPNQSGRAKAAGERRGGGSL